MGTRLWGAPSRSPSLCGWGGSTLSPRVSLAEGYGGGPQGSPCQRDRDVALGCPTEIRHVWGDQREWSRATGWNAGPWGRAPSGVRSPGLGIPRAGIRGRDTQWGKVLRAGRP